MLIRERGRTVHALMIECFQYDVEYVRTKPDSADTQGTAHALYEDVVFLLAPGPLPPPNRKRKNR